MADKESLLDEYKKEGIRLLSLKRVMRFFDIKDYKTLYKTLEAEGIKLLKFGDSDRVDIYDLESLIQEKKRTLVMKLAS